MIYLDHAATTRPDPQVVEAMLACYQEDWGNPSSIYGQGRAARRRLDQARDAVAAELHAEAREVIFTSGGSEADNLAVKGVARHERKRRNLTRAHVITAATEHHAVLHTVRQLAEEGFATTELPVDSQGRVSVEQVEAALRPETVLVAIMAANNEIGTLQPVESIGALCREHEIHYHCDAVQAAGVLPLHVDELPVDSLALSAHKFYGPKGSGVLWLRAGRRLRPEIMGGGQERERRSGTENVAGAVGLATALALATRQRPAESPRLVALRELLWQLLLEAIPSVVMTGHPTERLPGHLSVLIPGVDGESLLLNLDMEGVAASSGSACTAGSLDPSHVLLALGLTPQRARGSLRLTLGRENTVAEVREAARAVASVVDRLRTLAPAGTR